MKLRDIQLNEQDQASHIADMWEETLGDAENHALSDQETTQVVQDFLTDLQDDGFVGEEISHVLTNAARESDNITRREIEITNRAGRNVFDQDLII